MTTGITKEAVSLRSGPDTTNRILRQINAAISIEIVEKSGDWYKVKSPDGTLGYIQGQYLDVKTDQPATQPAPSTPSSPAPQSAQPVQPSQPAPVSTPTTPNGIAPTVDSTPKTTPPSMLIVPDGSLNVRSEPRISNVPDNRIETVAEGSLLTPLEDAASVSTKVGSTEAQNLWIKVRTESGKEGYVAARFVAYAPTVQKQTMTTFGTGTGPVGSVNGAALQPDLHKYIDTFAAQITLPQSYYDFWAQRDRLGLPDPFDVSPTKLDAAKIPRMPINGFGPNSFAAANWQSYYRNVCGMHNGLDHIVAEGTPLIAVSDGVILGDQTVWPFMGNRSDKTIVLWCFLPEKYRDSQGRRMLSNVMVAYAHMSNNTVVARRQVVKAGDVIGISGNPAGETHNAHLHLEVHMLSGDMALPRPGSRKLNPDYKRSQQFDNRTPFNPLLYFSERLAKYHVHQGKKLGFGSGPTYPDSARCQSMGLNWPVLDFFTLGNFQYGSASIWSVSNTPWPAGIYDMPTLLQRINKYTPFEPYPADFL